MDDSSNSSIIVGSIHGTATLTDANGNIGTIGFDINNLPSLNIASLVDSESDSEGVDNLIAGLPFSALTAHLQQQQQQERSEQTSNENNSPVSENPSNEQQNATENNAESNNRQGENIGVEVLADVIQSVMDAQIRFQPYLQQYVDMLLNDANEPPESPNATSTNPAANVINGQNANVFVLGGGDNRRQRFCNNINDMMHLLGHLYHNLSDLHVNMRDQPPRQMHTMSSMQNTALISASMPIDAASIAAFASSTSPANRQRTPRPTQPQPQPTQPSSQQQQQQQQSQSQPNRTSSSRGGPRFTQNPPIEIPSFSQQGLNNSYDQFLPCNSVHFYHIGNTGPQTVRLGPATQRRRHPAEDQPSTPRPQAQQQQQQQQAPQPETARSQPTSNLRSNPDDLRRFITNILSSSRGRTQEQHIQVLTLLKKFY